MSAMNASFGHWLAGLADGEGTFGVLFVKDNLSCRFQIMLRWDDRPLLVEIQERTGLGRIYDVKRSGARGGKNTSGSQNCVSWCVYRKDECLELVKLFRRFPLRSKKARDFEMWAEAVQEWQKISRWGARDWSRMEDLHVSLSKSKQHDI